MIGGQFDSLLAKLIVTGSDRAQALERSRRALAEFQVEGMATVLPFHRLVVDDPAFAPSSDEHFTVHTRWIETEWDNTVAPFTAASRPRRPRHGSRWSSRSGAAGWRCRCRATSLSAAAPAGSCPRCATTTRKRHGKGAPLRQATP